MAGRDKNRSKKDLDQLFEEIYQENLGKVSKYIETIVHDSTVAEDLTAEVFLTVWKKKEALLQYENIIGLLFKISRDTSINYLKSLSKNLEKKEKFFQFYFNHRYENNDHILREIKLLALEQAIEQLPEKCQKVVKMKFIMNKSLKEIASELHISVNTVQNHLTKGKYLIEEMMSTNDTYIVLLLYGLAQF